MQFIKKYGFFLFLVAAVVGSGVYLSYDTSTKEPTSKFTRPNTTSAVPGVVDVRVDGIVTYPEINSSVGETKAKDDGFNVKQALLYLNIDPKKATCMCAVVEYGSVMDTISDLKAILQTNDEAYLLIDSPGGSVFDGAMLVSFIEGSKKPIYTVAVGMAASMGFQILEVGHKRYATSNAVIMAHPAAGGLRGTVPEMESLLNFIKRYTENWDRKTAARAGIPYEKFEIMVLKNLWVTADEAKELGLLDDVVYID